MVPHGVFCGGLPPLWRFAAIVAKRCLVYRRCLLLCLTTICRLTAAGACCGKYVPVRCRPVLRKSVRVCATACCTRASVPWLSAVTVLPTGCRQGGMPCNRNGHFRPVWRFSRFVCQQGCLQLFHERGVGCKHCVVHNYVEQGRRERDVSGHCVCSLYLFSGGI